MWSVAGPFTTLQLLLPLLVVVCVSMSDMVLDVSLEEGVESAWLDVVPVVPVDDAGESSGGDDEAVVGIHDEEATSDRQRSR